MRPEVYEGEGRKSSSELSDHVGYHHTRTSAPSVYLEPDGKSSTSDKSSTSSPQKRRNSIAALQNSIQNKISSLTIRRRSSGLDEVNRGRRMSLSYTSTLTSCLRHSIERDNDVDCDITLNLALRNPKLLDMFRKFLQLEMSEENLDFYLAVEKLQSAKWSRKTPAKVRAEIQRIYSTHLVPGADFEINVGPAVRRQIDSAMRDDRLLDRSQLYREAQSEIYLLIKQDSFPRFKKYLKDNDLNQR